MQEEEQILSLLREITNRLSIKLNELYAPYGFTAVQFALLAELYGKQQVTMSQLAKQLAMTNSNCSAIVNRLESHGFVIREKDPMDQRTIHVRLSEQSIQILQDMRTIKCKNETVFDSVSHEDRQDILIGLEKLNQILKECDSYE